MAAEGGDGRPPVTEAAKTAVAPSPRSPPKYPDFCGRRRLQLEVQILNREVGFIEQEELQSLEGLQPVSRCCKEVNEFVGANPDPLIPLNKKRRRSCRIWRWLGSKLCFSFSWICCCTGCCHQLKRLRCSCPGCTCCPHHCTCPGCTCCSCCPHRCTCPGCTCCPHPKNPCCCRCCCEVSCCRPPRCCYCPELSCCRLLPRCCSWNLSCCRLPRCCRSFELSCCRPPQCCFREVSCSKLPRCCFVPSFSCPEYSCGCVWDCPRCTGVQLCPKCSRPCCMTGCLC